MTLLEMEVEEHGGTAVLVLTGELDISSAGRVEKELARLEDGDPGPLALDLSRLQFMDSTGLRIVVSADARARQRGRRFAVVRGPEAVQRIFRITRLEERLEMLDSRDQLAAPA
jgi:anti-sigma B factor antagonist